MNDDLVAVVGVDHRIAGVSFVENDRPDIRRRCVGRDAHNVRSRDHDLPNDRIVEIEHALEHVASDASMFPPARPGQYSAISRSPSVSAVSDAGGTPSNCVKALADR